MAGETMSATRIRAVDWLRGLACFDMIMWHAGALLSPEAAKDPQLNVLGFLAGLVAPSFMFAAGFAIALVMVRASGDPAARRRRAIKSLQRILEVLVVAFVLKVILRRNEPWWVVKIDILSCIALSLLLAWPVQMLLAPKPKIAAAVCGGLALVAFATAPLIPDGGWGVFIAPGSSDFPPIPWAGYVFLGSTAGAIASMGVGPTAWSFAGIVGLGALFRFGPWNAVYGNAWILLNSGERCMLFGVVALALLGIEQAAVRKRWALNWPPFSFLEIVGTNALTAYVTHIALLFIPVPPLNFSFGARWGGRSGWTQYWVLLGFLWALTLLVCWGWPKVSARFPWNRPKAPASAPVKAA